MSNLPQPPFQSPIQTLISGGNRVIGPWQQWISLLRKAVIDLQSASGGGTVATVQRYGSWQGTDSQALISATDAQAVKFDYTDIVTDGLSLALGQRILFGVAGVYNIQYSIQFDSTDTSIHDASVWFRKNGTDVSSSSSTISIPNQHGGVDGKAILAMNLLISVQAGDYIELWWSADNTNISIQTLPEGETPEAPQSPGVILTVVQA